MVYHVENRGGHGCSGGDTLGPVGSARILHGGGGCPGGVSVADFYANGTKVAKWRSVGWEVECKMEKSEVHCTMAWPEREKAAVMDTIWDKFAQLHHGHESGSGPGQGSGHVAQLDRGNDAETKVPFCARAVFRTFWCLRTATGAGSRPWASL